MKQISTPAVEYFFQDLDQVKDVPFTRIWEKAPFLCSTYIRLD